MKIGYARVSNEDQDLTLQPAQKKEGCEKIFQEKASGAYRDRLELKAALSFMREGDARVVWKLDRLARSVKQLIETLESFEGAEFVFIEMTMEQVLHLPVPKNHVRLAL